MTIQLHHTRAVLLYSLDALPPPSSGAGWNKVTPCRDCGSVTYSAEQAL